MASKLKRLLILAVFVTASASFAGDTPTESYFRKQPYYQSIYQFRDTESVDVTLLKFANDLYLKIKDAKPGSQKDEDIYLLGDSYHWLGHIAEDVEDYDKALGFYGSALALYLSTSVTSSRNTNDVSGIAHAQGHLIDSMELKMATAEARKKARKRAAMNLDSTMIRKVGTASQELIIEQRTKFRSLCEQYLTEAPRP